MTAGSMLSPLLELEGKRRLRTYLKVAGRFGARIVAVDVVVERAIARIMRYAIDLAIAQVD